MSAQGPTESEILHGSVVVRIKMQNGTDDAVKVRLLPVRLLQRYAAIADDAAAVAELFADKKPGWSDGVENASVYRIVAEGERVNAGPLADFVREQIARRARLAGIGQPDEGKASPDSSLAPATC